MRFPAFPLILIVLALPALADGPTLRVVGTGTVEAVPDLATLTLGVTAEDKTAAGAMARVSEDTAALRARLRAAGVEGRDLQTGELSLSPVWSSYDSGRDRRITGYAAANRLSVRLRDLDGMGALLDQAIGAGANSFQGLAFGLQDPGPLSDEARRQAVADARHKARLYAEAAGLTPGPVHRIEESAGAVPRPLTIEAARASAPVPVAPGEVTLEAGVTMVFALED